MRTFAIEDTQAENLALWFLPALSDPPGAGGQPFGLMVPELVGTAGKRASWRFSEFFTVNIRNANTRAAYDRAAASLLLWCEACGISELATIHPCT